jgi:prolipoprotein diacylglyceryl transferase
VGDRRVIATVSSVGALHAALSGVVGSIPSPSSGVLELGPLKLRAYGLMIALGVVAAIWLWGRRLEQKGIGRRDDASSIGMWAVGAGILGSRLYHVVTSWDSRFSNNPLRIFKIWEGGLGIPGGLLAGILVGVWMLKRRGLPVAHAVGAAAPAIPLAQAIGRWGNWWNQELFGRPTTLPWALRVDDEFALDAGYPAGTTFHPAFLYESLGNFAICGILLWIDRRFKLRPGRLMAWYLAGYSLLRFAVESVRIDEANKIAGLRVNTWVSGIVFLGAVAFLLRDRFRPAQPEPLAGESAGDEVGAAAIEVEESDGPEADLDLDVSPNDQLLDGDSVLDTPTELNDN